MRVALRVGLIAAAVGLVVLAVTAGGGSPKPERSGWPEGLRRELGLVKRPTRECTARLTRAMVRRQDRPSRNAVVIEVASPSWWRTGGRSAWPRAA